LIADAEHVHGAAMSDITDFEEADRTHTIKRVTGERLQNFALLIAACRSALSGQPIQGAALEGKTSDEVAARESIYLSIKKIQGDIDTSYPADLVFQKLFRHEKRLNRELTGNLLDNAMTIIDAFKDRTTRDRAEAAGVTHERVTELEGEHAALAAANKAQMRQFKSRKATTADKTALFARLSAETAAIRKVAEVVFIERPKKLVAYESIRARYTITPRTPKDKGGDTAASPAPAAGAAPAANDEKTQALKLTKKKPKRRVKPSKKRRQAVARAASGRKGAPGKSKEANAPAHRMAAKAPAKSTAKKPRARG
jgi:hypothetical protein